MCVIYTIHRAVPLSKGQEERGTVSLKNFTSQIQWLKRLGINFVRMSEFLQWWNGAIPLPSKSAVLTIDDGYLSVYKYIMPFLEKERMPAVLFAVPGLIGKTSHFYAGKGGHPLHHMNENQIREILDTGLVELGANGFNHLDLTKADSQKLEKEIIEAKNYLEETFSVPVPYYAYPFGRTSPRAVRLTRQAGYELAFTTEKTNINRKNTPQYELPRVAWSRRANVWKLSKYHFLPEWLL